MGHNVTLFSATTKSKNLYSKNMKMRFMKLQVSKSEALKQKIYLYHKTPEEIKRVEKPNTVPSEGTDLFIANNGT